MAKPSPRDQGGTQTIPLTGVARAAVADGSVRAAAKALGTETHDDHDHATLAGKVAAQSPATRTSEFTLAAVAWDVDSREAVTSVALRVRTDGTWGEWTELGIVDSGVKGTRAGSEPVLAPGSDGVQARVETTSGRTPAGLQVVLVDPGNDAPGNDNNGSNDNGNAPGNGNDNINAPHAGPDGGLRPTIVTRAQWGANEAWAWDASRSSTLKAMYVHHTVSSNTHTERDVPAMIRGMYRYHTQTLGWPDIGYQFLIDKFGNIYEGRRGSIEELVVGAQAGGYNTDTIGVSAIGSFHQKVKPSAAMEQAFVDVLAWQAYRYKLDPLSKVKLKTGSSTKSGTRWKAGKWTKALPAIRGHIDTNYTACPGGRLYDRLPAIRKAVAGKVAEATQLHGTPATVLPGPVANALRWNETPIRLSGSLTYRWKKVTGATSYEVLVRKASHGKALPSSAKGWKVHARTKALSHKISLPTGSTWTVAVRAVGPTGMKGMTRVIGTTTRAVSTSKHTVSKTSSKRWTVTKKAEYYRDHAWTTFKKGATVQVKGAKDVRTVWIIAPSGPRYGRVDVFAGARKVARVSMVSKKYTPQRRIKVTLPSRFTGTVKLKTLDKKRVRISAIVTAR